jgi:hypothetical protein
VVSVKANQAELLRSLQLSEQYLKPLSEHEQSNQGRGRQEHRCIRVYSPELIDFQRWIDVKSVLCIERWGECEGKAYSHKAYAISSVATSVSQWQDIIRGLGH